jgi:hypothetical protein
MYNNKCLLLAAASILAGFLLVSPANAQDAPCRYTVASLQGSYALIGYYAGGIGLALAVESVDGQGNMTRNATVNQPLAGSTTGERTRTITMSTGTYTVNCDGTGTLHRMQTNVTTGVTSTNESDIVITGAVVKDGQFIATALVSAQTTPSTIVPGGVFTNMVYTRLPDVPAATPSSTGTRPSK